MTFRTSQKSRRGSGVENPLGDLYHFSVLSLRSSFLGRRGPESLIGSGQHQEVVGEDAQPHPTLHAWHTTITAASEPVPSLQSTDAPFASRAPAHGPPKPALLLLNSPTHRYPSVARQGHASHSPLGRHLFIGGGGKSRIRRSQARRATKQLLVTLQ